MKTTTTLVVGATGATGKHVVLQLLQKNQQVRAIVRSKQRLLDSLDEILAIPNSSSELIKQLEVTEASVAEMSDDDLKKATKGCDAVVSCLGHNLTFQGIFYPPRRLVADTAQRLCEAIESNRKEEGKDDDTNNGGDSTNKPPTKFILMGTVAVPNPAGGDDPRTFTERTVITLLHYLLPPHWDNEQAAEYISKKMDHPELLEWTVVRPTDLVDGSSSKYELYPKPIDPLFGGEGVATRANVAKCMVDLILEDGVWEEWKFKMPVIHDRGLN